MLPVRPLLATQKPALCSLARLGGKSCPSLEEGKVKGARDPCGRGGATQPRAAACAPRVGLGSSAKAAIAVWRLLRNFDFAAGPGKGGLPDPTVTTTSSPAGSRQQLPLPPPSAHSQGSPPPPAHLSLPVAKLPKFIPNESKAAFPKMQPGAASGILKQFLSVCMCARARGHEPAYKAKGEPRSSCSVRRSTFTYDLRMFFPLPSPPLKTTTPN